MLVIRGAYIRGGGLIFGGAYIRDFTVSDFLGLFNPISDLFWLYWAKKSDILTLVRLI